jgi:hypothetical protein
MANKFSDFCLEFPLDLAELGLTKVIGALKNTPASYITGIMIRSASWVAPVELTCP